MFELNVRNCGTDHKDQYYKKHGRNDRCSTHFEFLSMLLPRLRIEGTHNPTNMASSCESSPKNQSPTDSKKDMKAAIKYSHVNVLSLGIIYTCLVEIKSVIVSYHGSPVSDLIEVRRPQSIVINFVFQ